MVATIRYPTGHSSNDWGIILADQGSRGTIHFKTIRSSSKNPYKENIAIARLLWRNEAQDLLLKLGTKGKILKSKREDLYLEISKRMTTKELQDSVRNYLIIRQDWRDQSRPAQYDG